MRDFLDRLPGEDKLPLGLGQHALPDQMPGGDAADALDVIVEPVRRHRELFRIEADQALLAEVLVDQTAQRFDGRIRRGERHRAGAGAAGGEPRHLDRDQREQAAHGQPEALAGEEAFLD